MSAATRRRLLAAGTAAGTLGAPAVLRAQTPLRWRMVTSWPRNLPGPGMNAQRLADRIARMSGGRLMVQLYAAGELVPALQVFDAVYSGAAEMAHTASFYWAGKVKAASFFTTVPFGLTPAEHAAWIEHGGGQALWDELYASFGIKPFMAGNSSFQMGGWFKRELKGLADLEGLKLRSAGLGGELFQRLGAVTVAMGVPDIYPALQNGTIDGVEFLGPASDLAAGFHQVAKFYYWPTFTKPNGTAECLVGLGAWQSLPDDLKAVVANACAAENAYTLAEADWRDGQALATLVEQHGVQLRRWPADIVAAARRASEEILAGFTAGSDLDRRIQRSYQEARQRIESWSRVSAEAYLGSRGGGA
ncbi:TRAP transporter substrate-binding protein [Benzoatithermus flavus]|uniref:TRAP transporter substrate-binding protein n=1 Tax=Benzoatithermus flavus TaxID=3108223 RepID=A0ABU8XND7_9PROT